MAWYKKRHMAMMDDMPFDGLKPPKDMDERLNQAGIAAQKTMSKAYTWMNVKTAALSQAATNGEFVANSKEAFNKTASNIGKGAMNVKEEITSSNHFKKFVGLFQGNPAP